MRPKLARLLLLPVMLASCAKQHGPRVGSGGRAGCSNQRVDLAAGAPDILIAFDRSASMELFSRWEPSKQAIESITRQFQAVVAFGLEIFPGEATEVDPIQLLLGGAMCG